MKTTNVKVKKWGNSLGIVIPKDILNDEDIKEGSELEITIRSKQKTKAKDIFGILKDRIKKPTEQLMKEVDKDLWKD